MTREIDDENPPAMFERHWFYAFAALDGGGPAVDCRPDRSAAVFGFEQEYGRTPEPQFEDFNALIDWWLELFAADQFYKPDDERQVAERELNLPEELIMLV
ncbi:MAG: hypothetical protein H0V81_04780 [Solirubrobacterales bacterium]|nr:hypothetical protein [Solirubrobacterales bacterium]